MLKRYCQLVAGSPSFPADGTTLRVFATKRTYHHSWPSGHWAPAEVTRTTVTLADVQSTVINPQPLLPLGHGKHTSFPGSLKTFGVC